MIERAVRLALTIGDPGGIGPAIAAQLVSRGLLGGTETFIVGSYGALREALPPSYPDTLAVVPSGEFDPAGDGRAAPVIIDTACGVRAPVGRPSAEGGLVAGRSIEIAAAMARSGAVEGIVTGPVSKEALQMAGFPYRGHTEMLSRLLDSPDCQMVMVSGDLRIVLLTRDIPLRDVPDAITKQRIKTCVRVTDAALGELWGIKRPRILVAALNPHAGDGGVNGREEIDVIVPALEELIAEGYRVGGPHPADTLFYRWREKGFDAFIALYHDQGMIPFKMGGFGTGVNVTIGLPVVRTSVCHGTAFDIAGRGEPDAGSLETAFATAVSCCLARRRTPGGARGARGSLR